MILIETSEEASRSISSCKAPSASLFFFTTKPINASSSSQVRLSSRFLGTRVVKLRIRLGPSNGSRTTCWFKFGKNGVDAENAGIYGSQSRDDFDRDDVEQYFNYMGMLAVEGTYDKMEALLKQNIHPIDILLLLAASEGDKPKIEELLRAGADYTVKFLPKASRRCNLKKAKRDWSRYQKLVFFSQSPYKAK